MNQISNLKIMRVPVSDLNLHPHNARQGDVGAICQSLEAHGQYRPLVVQKSSNTVLAGNHTLQAASTLGWKEVDVTFVDVDDDQALRILLVDNRSNDLAAYDNGVLTDLLEHLVRSTDGLAGTGFDGSDLDDLLAEFEDKTGADVLEDEPRTPPTAPITRLGDLWQLGSHRLICGDSTDADTYKALLGNDKADLVVTDPPYNVAYEGGTADKLTIENDNMSAEQFAKFLNGFFKATAANMHDGAPIYCFHGESAGADFRQQLTEAGLLLKQVLIWVKDRFVLGRQDYNWQHEPILYGWKPGAAHRWYGDFNKSTVLDDDLDPATLKKDELVHLLTEIRMMSTVIREDRPQRNAEHPTMKPVRLVARLMTNSSKPRDIVLDPFGGSGTTLMAAQQLNRRARIIELDPRYCDVICNRYQGATGITPVLEATGEAIDFID